MNHDSSPDQAPAHALWIELSTRNATQRLHYRSGNEETAATSIFNLFGKCRELMDAHPEATEFEKLVLSLLNETLRPYTARWHGWMTENPDERDGDGKPVLMFRDEWVKRQFRRELRALQPRLYGFQLSFEGLKDGKELESWWVSSDDKDVTRLRQKLDKEYHQRPPVNLGGSLAPGIGKQVSFAGHSDEQEREKVRELINQAELGEIRRKRGLPAKEAIENTSGIALSGGGLRSATFCLGVASVLARRKLLGQFDYLSTVSGGGYFGSFLSSYLGTGGNVTEKASDPQKEAVERIEETFEPGEQRKEPRGLRHLRNRSRYLIDGGFKETVIEVGLVGAGILFNLLITLPFSLIAALLVFSLNHHGFFGSSNWLETRWFPSSEAPVSWLFFVLTGIFVVGTLAFPFLKTVSIAGLRKGKKAMAYESWWKLFPWIAAATAVSLVLWLLPATFKGYNAIRDGSFQPWLENIMRHLEGWLTGLGFALTTVLGGVASKLKHGGKAGSAMKFLAFLGGPLLYLLVFFAVGSRIMFPICEPEWNWVWVAVMVGVTLLWAWLGVDVNTYSPHGYYRDRLCKCFLQARNKENPSVDNNVNRLRLSELNESIAAPYHLINTTVNLPSSDNRDLRGRDGDFYVMSKHFCGSPICGYYATTELEDMDPHFDLGTAMAISGAATSSNMGWKTDNSVRLLMTVANVRLGYWMRNPTFKPKLGPGPRMLFREMFAKGMDEKQRYLNLSDGGHIENLGAYELLRRRCKFIVCVDGGKDPGMECAELMRLERYAAIDLGIKMHYDLTDLTVQENGYSKAYGVLVKIDYAPPKDESERRERLKRKDYEPKWGWMLYLKLGMVGYGPGYVMDYKRENPDFPHQSTGDQIYDEAQFEAYRALGEAAAESMFMEELVEGFDEKEICGWFEALASNLLPDNDEVFGHSEEGEADTKVAKETE